MARGAMRLIPPLSVFLRGTERGEVVPRPVPDWFRPSTHAGYAPGSQAGSRPVPTACDGAWSHGTGAAVIAVSQRSK
jgi:hypothetical protein